LFSIGIFMPFIPSNHLVVSSSILSILLTIIIYKKYKIIIDSIQDYIKRKYFTKLIKVFVFIFTFMFIFETFAKPIPFIINIFIGKPHTMSTKIEAKDYSANSTSKRYYIITEEQGWWFLIGRGITISEKQYKKFKIGDQVYFKGNKSFLGMNVDHVFSKTK
jgi:hypothetical protein